MNGVLNIYKEKGYTSHDVVAVLRKIFKQKRIGHCGTLDPAAEGVLPVCLGRATRLVDEISEGTKTYRAVLLLGVETDTYDMEGQILSEKNVQLNFSEVCDCIYSFRGEVMQVPPMYSARKVNGQKLYDLARKGVEVERQAVPVHFHRLEIMKYDFPEITLEITCSKGTYIRSLCHDIGEKLGCGGCMKSLLRTRVGRFDMEDAVRLSEVKVFAEMGRLQEILTTIPDLFPALPRVKTVSGCDRLAENGNILSMDCFESQGISEEENRLIVYDSEGRLIGLYRRKEQRDEFLPDKMLLED